jgi:Ni,Fe-hydrogenase maturation factor
MPEKSLALLTVDAADISLTPGEFSLIELDELKNMGVSTHTADLSLLFGIIPN